MKFIFNKFPDNQSFSPEKEEWTSFKEPSNIHTTILLSAPVSFLNLLIVIYLFKIFNLNSNILNTLFPDDFLFIFLIFTIVVAPIHEILHAIFFPCKLTSNNIYFGFIPKGLIFFAFYTEMISKKRYCIVLIMPFLIITIIGTTLLKLFGDISILKTIILYNAAGSCMDIFSIFIILFQAPKNAVIKNKGMKSYWKI